jgi:hypothetical protein
MKDLLYISLGVVFNILSVVGVVLCNKYITEVDGYDFMVFLSCLHFTVTAVAVRIFMHLGYFKYQSAPLEGVLPVAVGSLLSVAFMNLNLSYNSVGFYQVTYVLALLYYGFTVGCRFPSWLVFHSLY